MNNYKEITLKNGLLKSGLKDKNGIALVVTLLALVLIITMVVEFSYAVYTNTNSLYNWRDSQRLSFMALSGMNVSARFLSDMLDRYPYSYPGSIELPVENPFEDFEGIITVRIEDETSKFNINSLIRGNGTFNENAYLSLKKLLENLSLPEQIADRIADWIDQDKIPRISGSETAAKNSALITTDEILLIHGINKKDYDKLLPYITVYGNRNTPVINVNGAEVPVLMSILDTGKGEFPITEDIAKRIKSYRENIPFEDIGKFNAFAGTSLSSNQITTKGENFYIKTVAVSSNGIKRIIESVLEKKSISPPIIKYWKEY